jgi:aminoglycoside N3'-acetyltransferase
MNEVAAGQVSAVLGALGVQPGDGLLVHAAVQYLGRPQGGLVMYCQALGAAVGLPWPPDPHRLPLEAGDLAMPAFNFGFARGQAYDPAATPSEKMGALAEFFRRQPGVLRTPHPLQSLAVAGRHAADLAGRDTPGAFDPGSAWERLLELDFKLLLLGADIQAASIYHYSEQRAGVPYRYWKEFSGDYHTPHGWERRAYRMFVRDLALDPHIELYPLQGVLEARGQWRSAALNYGRVSVCRLGDFIAAADESLAADPWQLIVNRKPAA